MQQYRIEGAERSKLKAVKHWENESLKDNSQKVQFFGALAFSEKSFTERDQDVRDQFLEGLLDLRLQLYEDESDRYLCELI